MRSSILLACCIALAGCGTTTAQQAQLASASQTLASVAASNSTTVASLVTKGTLFCKKVGTASPLIVALADASGAPVTVVNQTATAVASACAAIQAIPVPPPADPTVVPVVASSTALPTTATVAPSAVSVIIPHGGSISARSDLQQSCVISEHLISGCAFSGGASVAASSTTLPTT